jgi:hypothetical protein
MKKLSLNELESIAERSITWIRVGLVVVVLGLCAVYKAYSQEPPTDLPREQPATATGFIYCEPATGHRLIVAVIVTYKSGKVVRFDIEHMHGITSVVELEKYADSAPDSAVYGSGPCNSTAT